MKKTLSGSALKWIACVSMLIDHATAALLLRGYLKLHSLTPQIKVIYYVLRGIGRLAFPIYVFLLVEGFLHTRSRVKYAFRLFLFMLISEMPFDIARGNLVDWKHQNVFWTLFLGFCAMWIIDAVTEGDIFGAPLVRRIAGWTAAGIIAVAAWYLHTDYGAYGVALIVVFYMFYAMPEVRDFGGAVILLVLDMLEACAFVDFILFRMYNGKRGRQSKYLFYIIYPAHLLLFAAVRYLWMGIGVNGL